MDDESKDLLRQLIHSQLTLASAITQLAEAVTADMDVAADDAGPVIPLSLNGR